MGAAEDVCMHKVEEPELFHIWDRQGKAYHWAWVSRQAHTTELHAKVERVEKIQR